MKFMVVIAAKDAVTYLVSLDPDGFDIVLASVEFEGKKKPRGGEKEKKRKNYTIC